MPSLRLLCIAEPPTGGGQETLRDIFLPELNLMVRQVMTVEGDLMVYAAACGPPGRCPRNSVGVRDSACVKLRLCGGRTALLGQLIAPSVPARAARIPGIDEFAFRKGPDLWNGSRRHRDLQAGGRIV
ncbi:hypothetical protein [Streptomyces sp. NPDC002763]|uniref:hypothetical protein n=1 Tax=Streptomyces sp. NPDC002763 TaxID=3154427 RepID=UPI0033257570